MTTTVNPCNILQFKNLLNIYNNRKNNSRGHYPFEHHQTVYHIKMATKSHNINPDKWQLRQTSVKIILNLNALWIMNAMTRIERKGCCTTLHLRVAKKNQSNTRATALCLFLKLLYIVLVAVYTPLTKSKVNVTAECSYSKVSLLLERGLQKTFFILSIDGYDMYWDTLYVYEHLLDLWDLIYLDIDLSI